MFDLVYKHTIFTVQRVQMVMMMMMYVYCSQSVHKARAAKTTRCQYALLAYTTRLCSLV